MRKSLFIIFCLSLTFSGKAQKVNVSYEKTKSGFAFFADNEELFPVSLSIDFVLSNMKFSEGDRKIFVIPSKNNKFKIGELRSIELAHYKFNYTYQTAMGDVTQESCDTSYIYELPFQKGKRIRVSQGYNGVFSHQNSNSLDFSMSEGTEILAARDGIIVKVNQDNSESCPREECKKFNNFIIIMHSDGTFAYYAHIKQNGSNYKVGDEVKSGNVIAYSGNVGWSSGPHLHFSCFLGGLNNWRTLEVKFRTNNGDNIEVLKEGISYLRNY